MKSSNFFKPTWGKLIFPILIVIIVTVLFFVSYYQIGRFNSQNCEINDFLKNVADARARGDNETITRLYENKPNIEFGHLGLAGMFTDIASIDPFFPISCELKDGYFCNHYSSRKDYDCMVEGAKFIQTNNNALFSLTETNMIEYREINYLQLALNLMGLFILAYLISCISSVLYQRWEDE